MGKSNDFTVNDPIHGMICFKADANGNNLIKDLISTPEFQRLRRIKQLGCVDFVYPGATHTRFAHSIGVAHLVNKTMRHVLSTEEKYKELSAGNYLQGYKIDQAILAVTCAGLLHDLGHGPFGHSLEKMFYPKRHEDISTEIIKSTETSIGKILLKYCDGNILPTHAIEDIVFMISSDVISSELEDEKNPLLPFKDIISSQLDCDRLDYLQRDTYYCGTPIRIDVNYLINNFDIRYVPLLEHYKLVINIKAKPSLEHYLLSRKLHYDQVAYHKTSMAAESLLSRIIQLLFLKTEDSLDSYIKAYFIPENKNNITLNEFLQIDDLTITSIINKKSELKKQNSVNRLCKCFINRLLPKLYDPCEYKHLYDDMDDKEIIKHVYSIVSAKLHNDSDSSLHNQFFFSTCNFKDYYEFEKEEYNKLEITKIEHPNKSDYSSQVQEKIYSLMDKVEKGIFVFDKEDIYNFGVKSNIAELNKFGRNDKVRIFISKEILEVMDDK